MPQAPTVAIPKRLPLVITPENRAGSTDKDSKLVNCYGEKLQDGSYRIYKRAGLTYSSQPSGGTAVGLGAFNWLGDIYTIFGATMYKNGAPLVGVLNTTNGVYRFSQCLGATPRMIFGDGVAAYTYDSGGGIVQITDGDFPASFCKGWAYVDGTTYVLRPDAGIQGDDINTPSDWDPLNVIIAQISPDKGMAMAKQLVYAIALKQWSSEVFYDAGNAVGSPLGPVQGARVSFGCVTAESVQSIDDILVWVTTNQSGSVQVVKMEGLKAEIISTDPIERLLDKADFTTTYSLQFKNIGHRFYILTLVVTNITLVYDLDQRMWHQWTDKDGNYFPFVAGTYNSSLQHIFQHATNGKLYLMDETYYTDAGDVITVDIVTPNFDAGTNRRKQLTMMKFIADQVDGSVLQVRKNDNDYATDTWSNFREVDLSKQQPVLPNNGTFVRRAYQLRHQKQTFFRIEAIELQLDIGTL